MSTIMFLEVLHQNFSSARMGIGVSESAFVGHLNSFMHYVVLNEPYCNCICDVFNKSIL